MLPPLVIKLDIPSAATARLLEEMLNLGSGPALLVYKLPLSCRPEPHPGALGRLPRNEPVRLARVDLSKALPQLLPSRTLTVGQGKNRVRVSVAFNTGTLMLQLTLGGTPKLGRMVDRLVSVPTPEFLFQSSVWPAALTCQTAWQPLS